MEHVHNTSYLPALTNHLPAIDIHTQNRATNNYHLPPACRHGERIYRLEIAQQPIRARMCGFGDKDRRPITPPPCIKLTVTNLDGEEIEPRENEQNFYVLLVNLWNVDMQEEVDLVRHGNTSPAMAISSATHAPFPPPAERMYTLVPQAQFAPQYPPQQFPPYGQPQFAGQPYNAPGMIQRNTHYVMDVGGMGQAAAVATPLYIQPQSGMFTKNLIGSSCAVGAQKLQDDKGKPGYWFVLQDLSVRTEGTFRLRMSFVDVSDQLSRNGLNQDKARILASCFSDPFTVYSAKKFPGVIESTPLSKAFANQGIKIPIRKDSAKQIPNADEFADDEQ